MPAPDVQYFLDSALEVGHITLDTHHHFMRVSARSNAVVDSYQEPPGGFARHWNRLIDMGLHVENEYIRFRRGNRDQARVSSAHAARYHANFVAKHAHDMASWMVDKGHTRLSDLASSIADREMGLSNMRGSLRRATTRILADLSDRTPEQLRDLIDQEERVRAEVAEIDDIMRAMGGREDIDVKTAMRFLAQQRKEQRKVIKRSVKLFERLMGGDTTRLFVGGDRLRIEGRHAIYELKRTAAIHVSHGGARLSVFTKQDDIHLCDLCIFTPNVPLLDHVASIVMHIRADQEEDILKIGNAYNLDDRAYDHDWLVPFLPVRKNEFPADLVLADLADDLGLVETRNNRLVPIRMLPRLVIEDRQAKLAALEQELVTFFEVDHIRTSLAALPFPDRFLSPQVDHYALEDTAA